MFCHFLEGCCFWETEECALIGEEMVSTGMSAGKGYDIWKKNLFSIKGKIVNMKRMTDLLCMPLSCCCEVGSLRYCSDLRAVALLLHSLYMNSKSTRPAQRSFMKIIFFSFCWLFWIKLFERISVNCGISSKIFKLCGGDGGSISRACCTRDLGRGLQGVWELASSWDS